MGRKIVRVRAPAGFRWKIVERKSVPGYTSGCVYVQLVHQGNSRKIGEIRLYKEEDGRYETHSNLDSKYHGRGYGAKLYARAIQWCLENGHSVRSSGSSSEEAQRVWRGKTIRKFFRIRTKHFRYAGQKIIDPDNDTFFAYPKLERKR